MDVGNTIKKFIAESGMSQAELSRKSGIAETSISRLKTQKSCNTKNWVKLMSVIEPEQGKTCGTCQHYHGSTPLGDCKMVAELVAALPPFTAAPLRIEAERPVDGCKYFSPRP